MRHRKVMGFIAATAMSLLLVACGSDKKEVVDIGITPGTKTITMGQQTTFAVTTTNTDYSVSTDKAAAGCVKTNATTVTCTPTAADTYTLTVTATADKNKTKTATLVVNPVTITISPETVTITATQSVTFEVNTEVNWPTVAGGTLTPNADGKSATFTSDTPDTYTIIVTAKADNNITKSATVIVEPAEPTVSIKSGETATVEQKKTIQFEADVLIPKGQPEQTPTWTVEGDCGTIDEQTGLFTAAATPGTCVVKASIVNVKGDAITDRANVTVTGPEEIEGMVYVEAGTFTMGCDGTFCAADGPSSPAFEATFTKDFYIGKFEVTQARWKEVMGADSNPSEVKGDDYPVINITWSDIMAPDTGFLAKLNKQEADAGSGRIWRLPTEAEWEYAARGGVKSLGYTHSGAGLATTGAGGESVAWYKDNSGNTIHPVGQLQPNELGIYDMSGNVSEWVSDWYGAMYIDAEPKTDPQGPDSNRQGRHVRRGGAFNSTYNATMVTSRGYADETAASAQNILGFRLVLTITEPSAPTPTVQPTFFESASATVSGLWDSAVSGIKSLWNSITK